MMQKKRSKNIFSNSRGFSLIEVLLGITIFMIGMLGVTALNISSLKSNTFSGNMSEAVTIVGDRIEQIMTDKFADLKDTDADGTNQDNAANPGIDIIDGGNFGLDDTGAGADDQDLGVGRNSMYNVYWNVAVGEPLPENTKTVNVIVEWEIKGITRTMSMSTIIFDHD